MTRRTPLYDRHVALGARMVPFAGFEMPVQYSGIQAEHHAVRNHVGIVDVSHMGEFLVSGPGADAFIQRMTINDAGALTEGAAQYSAMCYPDGGLVDDLLIYKLCSGYMLVVNADNLSRDFEWLKEHGTGGVELTDISDATALIAVQGPASRELLRHVFADQHVELPFYNFRETVAGFENVILSRTGYTGELGFEIYCPAAAAPDLWDQLLAAGEDHGIQPFGLGARDTLRMEMKYCLYGNDIDETTNPFEAGLGWITKLDSAPFIGSDRLVEIKAQGPTRRLVCFEMDERAIPRHGYAIRHAGEAVGVVTSGTQSPTLGKGIGIGYVDRPHTKTGTGLEIMIRGQAKSATIIKPPFVKDTSLMAGSDGAI